MDTLSTLCVNWSIEDWVLFFKALSTFVSCPIKKDLDKLKITINTYTIRQVSIVSYFSDSILDSLLLRMGFFSENWYGEVGVVFTMEACLSLASLLNWLFLIFLNLSLISSKVFNFLPFRDPSLTILSSIIKWNSLK